MKTLSSSLLALALVAGPLAGAATAQSTDVTVNLSTIAADIAAELGIDVSTVPETIVIELDDAAEACGLDPEDFGAIVSCDAFSVTNAVLIAIDPDYYDDEDGNGNGNGNSAREFAPGQQDGPATDYAPGQQDGPAKDHAPGQLKKQN